MRRGDLLSLARVGGARRGGGSSWQSLARGLGSIETDYLNGEIVLLGRLHGVPTPANALVQRLADQAARQKARPGASRLRISWPCSGRSLRSAPRAVRLTRST